MALGGVPTIVPMPPMLAPKATAMSSALPKGSPASIAATTGATTASIIAAVAVFDMNMEKAKLNPSTPSRRPPGVGPDQARTRTASTRSSPVLAAAAASTKPPKNSQMIGSPSTTTNCCQSFGVLAKTPPGRPSSAHLQGDDEHGHRERRQRLADPQGGREHEDEERPIAGRGQTGRAAHQNGDEQREENRARRREGRT